MQYADLRGYIHSGDVLAWTHKASPWRSWYDFKVWLVRLFTRSEYSHVGIAWRIAGRLFVIESVTPLVRIVPLSAELPCYHLAGFGLTDAQLEKALDLVGIGRYSQSEAAWAYVGKNDLANDAWECAEFVCYVLGLPCGATPAEVVDYLLTNGSRLTEIR